MPKKNMNNKVENIVIPSHVVTEKAPETVQPTIMKVTCPAVNVRKAPSFEAGIAGVKFKYDEVSVYEINGKWAKVGENMWIAKEFLK